MAKEEEIKKRLDEPKPIISHSLNVIQSTTKTTTVVEENEGQDQYGAVYVLGMNPPGTALCYAGHIFTFMTTNPYPGDTATCDNCIKIINWAGGYHCRICEVDLCLSLIHI